ncbi:MAG: phosphoribosylformylglycinamidine synthase II, partial [Hyphomicrobiales bacterium]|nr:phosphoribosylformylglycinamidine synthase II [Hyphomicrobiales bacterium]
GASIARLPVGPAHAILFGEDQGRYLVACAAGTGAGIVADATARSVPALVIGAAGGDALRLPGVEPILLQNLRNASESALPAYMAGGMPDGFVNC